MLTCLLLAPSAQTPPQAFWLLSPHTMHDNALNQIPTTVLKALKQLRMWCVIKRFHSFRKQIRLRNGWWTYWKRTYIDRGVRVFVDVWQTCPQSRFVYCLTLTWLLFRICTYHASWPLSKWSIPALCWPAIYPCSFVLTQSLATVL
jgi:hypothetical protein